MVGVLFVVGIIINFILVFGGMFIDLYKEVKCVRVVGGQGSLVSFVVVMSVGKGMGGMIVVVMKGVFVDFLLVMVEGLW